MCFKRNRRNQEQKKNCNKIFAEFYSYNCNGYQFLGVIWREENKFNFWRGVSAFYKPDGKIFIGMNKNTRRNSVVIMW